jgi:hypothetical protein
MGDIGVDERIILKYIMKNQVVKMQAGLNRQELRSDGRL